MTIETKYNKNDKVMIIENNKIISVTVYVIMYNNGRVQYDLLIKKALTLMDKDYSVIRDEEDVYANVEEIAKTI